METVEFNSMLRQPDLSILRQPVDILRKLENPSWDSDFRKHARLESSQDLFGKLDKNPLTLRRFLSALWYPPPSSNPGDPASAFSPSRSPSPHKIACLFLPRCSTVSIYNIELLISAAYCLLRKRSIDPHIPAGKNAAPVRVAAGASAARGAAVLEGAGIAQPLLRRGRSAARERAPAKLGSLGNPNYRSTTQARKSIKLMVSRKSPPRSRSSFYSALEISITHLPDPFPTVFRSIALK